MSNEIFEGISERIFKFMDALKELFVEFVELVELLNEFLKKTSERIDGKLLERICEGISGRMLRLV